MNKILFGICLPVNEDESPEDESPGRAACCLSLYGRDSESMTDRLALPLDVFVCHTFVSLVRQTSHPLSKSKSVCNTQQQQASLSIIHSNSQSV